MIWQEYMCTYLVGRGLRGNEALAIITVYLDDAGQAMAERINDHMEGYPSQLIARLMRV